MPKPLNRRSAPKYYDVLQAAVSASKMTAPPETTRAPFDLYNESIANRNALYSKPLRPSTKDDVLKVSSTQGGNHSASTQNADTQRASFDAMRASRNAKFSMKRPAVQESENRISGTSSASVHDHANQYRLEGIIEQDHLGTVRKNTRDMNIPRSPSEGRRTHREGGGASYVARQLSQAMPKNSISKRTAANPRPSSDSSKLYSDRETTKELSISDHTAEGYLVTSPTALTLKPFEDGSNPLVPTDTTLHHPISYSRSKGQGNFTGDNQMLAGRHQGLAFDDVPPRTSSDRSARKHQKSKRLSQDLAITASGPKARNEQDVQSVHSKEAASSARSADLSGNKSVRESDEVFEDKRGNRNEGATTTHHADPVQMLRASVVPANDYSYRGGDNVIDGRVLNHGPRQGCPYPKMMGYHQVP